MSNFENPTWRTAAILKIVIPQYLSRESSEFDEIWYELTGGISFQPTLSNFTRRHVFSSTEVIKSYFLLNSALVLEAYLLQHSLFYRLF